MHLCEISASAHITIVAMEGDLFRDPRLFIILFVRGLFAILGGFIRNFGRVCSQFLFEVLLAQIREEIRHFAGWKGGRRSPN